VNRSRGDSTGAPATRKIKDAMGRAEAWKLFGFATLAFAGCGRSGLPLGEVAGWDAGADGGAGQRNDAATLDAGDGDSPVEGGATPEFFGAVSVGTDGYRPDFVPWAQPVPGPGLGPCSGLQVGSCCYVPTNNTMYVVDADQPARWFPQGSTSVSAGPIVFRNGPDTYTLRPPYDSLQKTVPSDIDDTVYVAAAGDVVHSFQGSIVVPGYVVKVVLPVGMVAPRDADLTVSWAPDGPPAERMWLSMPVQRVLHFDAGPWADAGMTEFAAEIDCDVPDSAGAVVVAAGMLGMLQAGDSAGVSLTRYVVNLVSADNAVVALHASTLFTPGAPLVLQ
jgi:hypothetical protein